MAKQAKNAISPRREEDYPEWYQQIVRAADLAETSPVRGCMVIKPWGYSLWENIKDGLTYPSRVERLDDARFFYEVAAAHVDEHRPLRARPQSSTFEQPARRRRRLALDRRATNS